MFGLSYRYQTIIYPYIIAALLPAIFLMYYIYKHDVYEKEPMNLLLKLIFGGVLAAGLAGILEAVLENNVLSSIPFTSANQAMTALALMVGLVEEGSKLLFLKRWTWKNPNFNYRFDAVVYAVFVSLGFAALENIFYVLQYGMQVAVTRAFLAVPAHMGFAVYMGAYYGRAKQEDIRGHFAKSRLNILVGYLSAVSLHTLYDATAMIGSDRATTLFIGFVIIMYVIIYRKIKRESAQDNMIY